MGIMSRVLRLCKADMHGVVDQLEDKELLHKQYLREMESDLRQKEGRLQQLEEDGKNLLSLYFFMIPRRVSEKRDGREEDVFEKACGEVESILRQGTAG